MSAKDTGGPAFPIHPDMPTPNDHGDPTGMTLREYFAAKAMQGIISAVGSRGVVDYQESSVASSAYLMADAMLREREK